MPVSVSSNLTAGTEALAADAEKLGGNNNLRAEAKSSPSMVLNVKAGIAIVDGQLVEKSSDADSPTFSAPGSNNRIDLLVMDSAGTYSVIQGTAAASPTMPLIPTDKIAICAVYLRTGSSVINDTDAGGATSYIYQDLRSLVTNRISRMIISRLTAGEALSVRDAVVMGDDIEFTDPIRQWSGTSEVSFNTAAAAKRIGQSFTTPKFTTKITEVDISLGNATGGSGIGGDLTVNVYATDGAGKPTGASLGNATLASGNFTTGTDLYVGRFTFSGGVTLSPSTKYALVWNQASSDTTHYVSLTYMGSDVLANGNRLTSTDSGANWTVETDDLRCIIKLSRKLTAGKLYKADSDDNALMNVAGIVLTAASADGDLVLMAEPGSIVPGFSSLTQGREYWLQDTAGTVGLTPSTTAEIKVGEAVSATEIKIKPDKKYRRISRSLAAVLTGSSSTKDIENIPCGFRIKKVEGYITGKGDGGGTAEGWCMLDALASMWYHQGSGTNVDEIGTGLLLWVYTFNGSMNIIGNTVDNRGFLLQWQNNGNVSGGLRLPAMDFLIIG